MRAALLNLDKKPEAYCLPTTDFLYVFAEEGVLVAFLFQLTKLLRMLHVMSQDLFTYTEYVTFSLMSS